MTPHAVRWARREVRHELEYTRWHWTDDAQFTACGHLIPVGLDGTFLPETDERPERVTCARCRARSGGATPPGGTGPREGREDCGLIDPNYDAPWQRMGRQQ